MLTGIVAVSEDGVIGNKGKIPWHIPEDMKFFRETTYGSAVIMGRKTYESLKHPLDHRLNVVLSKESTITGLVTHITDVDQAKPVLDNMKTFIIGGTAIYALFAKQITNWIVTHVPVTCGLSDTYFPAVFLERFKVNERKSIPCKNGMTLKIEYLERA